MSENTLYVVPAVSAKKGFCFQLVLLGAEEGLYSMSLEKPGRSSPRALPGIDRAFQLDIISDLNLLVMIAGTILACPPSFLSSSLACIEMNYIFYYVLTLKKASIFKKCYKKHCYVACLKPIFSPDILQHFKFCSHLLCSYEYLVNLSISVVVLRAYA